MRELFSEEIRNTPFSLFSHFIRVATSIIGAFTKIMGTDYLKLVLGPTILKIQQDPSIIEVIHGNVTYNNFPRWTPRNWGVKIPPKT
jgi:hypothetical protein